METVDILKILSYPIILGLAMIPGVIPLTCPCCSKNKRCLANTHTFSGGVFITMGLLHIFPESVVQFHEQYPELYERFPIPEALFIFGYCLVMIFEKVVCGGHHHCDHEGHAHVGHAHVGHDHSHNHDQCHHHKNNQHESVGSFHHHVQDHDLINRKKPECFHAQNQKHIGCILEDTSAKFQVHEQAPLTKDLQARTNSPQEGRIPKLQLMKNDEKHRAVRTNSSKQFLKDASSTKESLSWLEQFLNRADKEQCKKKNCEKKCDCLDQKKEKPTKEDSGCCADSFIILSLSIHTFFEGLALGVLANQSEVFSLLIGIILHNWAESLSIGAALAKRDEKRQHRARAVVLLFIYAILSPIGISIGWALLKFSTPIVAILASALSGGTFLYIGATEVVNEDFKGSRLWAKSFYYILGGVVIMVATAITENTTEGHSH